jgi:hypothetical protein
MCYPRATHLVVVKAVTPNIHVGQPLIVPKVSMGQHQISPPNNF